MGDVFFYTEGDKKQDQKIHDPILSAGDRRFKKSQAYKDTLKYAVETLGLTEEEARKIFG